MTTEQKIFVTMFVLGDTVTYKDISDYTELTVQDIKLSLEKIKKYIEPIGISISEAADGIQLTTIKEARGIILNIKKQEIDGDLSPSSLQVMTVIAYLPGCSRSDISYIRGSQSSTSIRNLITRGLIYKKGEQCWITNEALTHLGVTNNLDLPEFKRLNEEFNNKLQESLKYE